MVSFTTHYHPISPWLHKIFFVGVILHEITHHIVLSLFDFEVTEYQLYSTDNKSAEYITYQGKISIFKVICVNYAPISMTIIALVYCVVFWPFITSTPLISAINLYVLTSCILYGYPSNHDIQSVKEYAQNNHLSGFYPLFIEITQTITQKYEQLLPLISLIFVSVYTYVIFV